MVDALTGRVRPCPQAAVTRVRGTHRLTADLCSRHARRAVNRPRLVREWVLTGDPGGSRAPMPVLASTEMAAGVGADVRLPLAADPRAVGLARAAVGALLARQGWPDALHPPVQLATSEAVANAVEHGSEPAAIILVLLSAGPESAWIAVTDRGRLAAAMPLRPPSVPPPDRTRGRGLHIMARLADDVEVVSDGRGTQVLLRFARRDRDPAEDGTGHDPAGRTWALTTPVTGIVNEGPTRARATGRGCLPP